MRISSRSGQPIGQPRWIAPWFAECRLREEERTRERERERAARLPILLFCRRQIEFPVYSPGNDSTAMLIERTNKECLERTEMAKEGAKQTFVHRTTVLTTDCTTYSPCSSHHSSPFSFVLIFASHYEASSFVCRRQPPVNHSLTHLLALSYSR